MWDWLGVGQAQVQRKGPGRILWGPVTIRKSKGPGRLQTSPGLALSRDPQVHITLVKNTLVGDIFYLKCGKCRRLR